MKKKVRIIVRPWIPRRIPYLISANLVKKKIEFAYPKLKKVLYVGWVRRKVNGRSSLLYLAATADTTKDARFLLKKGELYGENIWNLIEDSHI